MIATLGTKKFNAKLIATLQNAVAPAGMAQFGVCARGDVVGQSGILTAVQNVAVIGGSGNFQLGLALACSFQDGLHAGVCSVSGGAGILLF